MGGGVGGRQRGKESPIGGKDMEDEGRRGEREEKEYRKNEMEKGKEKTES